MFHSIADEWKPTVANLVIVADMQPTYCRCTDAELKKTMRSSHSLSEAAQQALKLTPVS